MWVIKIEFDIEGFDVNNYFMKGQIYEFLNSHIILCNYYFRTKEGAENNVFKIICEELILQHYNQVQKYYIENINEDINKDYGVDMIVYFNNIEKILNDVIDYELIYNEFKNIHYESLNYKIEEYENNFYLEECDEYQSPIFK
jgi:hypothetical protein